MNNMSWKFSKCVIREICITVWQQLGIDNRHQGRPRFRRFRCWAVLPLGWLELYIHISRFSQWTCGHERPTKNFQKTTTDRTKKKLGIWFQVGYRQKKMQNEVEWLVCSQLLCTDRDLVLPKILNWNSKRKQSWRSHKQLQTLVLQFWSQKSRSRSTKVLDVDLLDYKSNRPLPCYNFGWGHLEAMLRRSPVRRSNELDVAPFLPWRLWLETISHKLQAKKKCGM